ncbi:GNAT family N-acetyltransferase [Antrihabitans cavernicola]
MLRPVEASDIPALAEWFRDEEFRGLFGYRLPISSEYWPNWIGRNSEISYQRAVFMICKSGQHSDTVGMCWLRHGDQLNRTAEAAIGIARERRQGMARSAILALIRFGFETLGLNRVECRIADFNTPSKQLALSVGGVEEARLRCAYYWNGEFHDLCIFGMLRSDFDRLHGQA